MDVTRSNSRRWLHHFETNRLGRPEPDWDRPCTEEAETAAQLARSLSHFQLGESGGGTFLLAEARRTHPDDPDYVGALALFVAEEQEHARLLAGVVDRFGGTLTARHWTHDCFRLVRRALGVQFEIQTLLVAEVIGNAYYRLLQAHAGDAVLLEVCDLILRDEDRHIEFHRDRFAAWQVHWLPLERALWAAQFQAFLLAAAHAAWLDHRPALIGVGVGGRKAFLWQVRREAAVFLDGAGAVISPAGGGARTAGSRRGGSTPPR